MNTLYHNSRCSKSREALRLMQEAGLIFELRDYINRPPEPAELEALCRHLGLSPFGLVREKDLVQDMTYPDPEDDAGWIQVLCTTPRLLERPIAGINDKWAIARPPERLLDLL